MDLKSWDFASKPNNNQKKAKNSPKASLNNVSARAAAALFKDALALALNRSVHLPGAPRLFSVYYDSTILHFYNTTATTFYTNFFPFESF